MFINEKAQNVSLKEFLSIYTFNKWKNKNPQYTIYSIDNYI